MSEAATPVGQLLPYRPKGVKEETTAFIGMVIFLGSWAMMFAALFFVYGGVRARAGTWPPVDLPALPLWLPLANTLVIALSSAALQYGLFSVQRAKVKALGPALLWALLLGALFLGLQTLLWASLWAEGLTMKAGGAYASVFYGLTALHALHVLVGLAGIGRVCARAFGGEFSAARYLPVRLWAMYWHFVGVVWALMFVSIFVM
ncbi:MAG: cytochrome c oxidase subunit 3 [Myxococcota bacterium]